MVFRRCPQCGSKSNDVYGFCIKCGYEFPKIEAGSTTCPLCGFNNPDEADYCVKCGTPLLFKNPDSANGEINHVTIQKTVVAPTEAPQRSRFITLIVLLGYLFSILGGLLGIVIAIYLITRKDPGLKRHGYIQLAIFMFYVIVIAVLYMTGNIPADIMAEYRQLLAGNMTSLRL